MYYAMIDEEGRKWVEDARAENGWIKLPGGVRAYPCRSESGAYRALAEASARERKEVEPPADTASDDIGRHEA